MPLTEVYSALQQAPAGTLVGPVESGANPVNASGVTIGFGRGVVLDTADDTVKLPASGGVFAGVIYDNENQPVGATGYPTASIAGMVKRGKVMVVVEEAVTPADPVYCRYTTAGDNTPGSFRKDADSSKAMAVTQARFLASGGPGLVPLEISLP